MKDIQLIRLLDVLSVSRIQNAPGVIPRSVYVDGKDFRHIESVVIDGLTAPEFVVLSPSRLIAEVPEPLRDSVLRTVSVLSTHITLTERSLVEFTVGTRPRAVSGTAKLMQTFIRLLLRSPGSNIFHPRSGGGMLRRIGRSNIDAQTAADVAIAVSRTRQYLVNIQAADRAIPAAERLLSAEITGLSAKPEDTTVHVTILLTSHSGQRAASTLVA